MYLACLANISNFVFITLFSMLLSGCPVSTSTKTSSEAAKADAMSPVNSGVSREFDLDDALPVVDMAQHLMLLGSPVECGESTDSCDDFPVASSLEIADTGFKECLSTIESYIDQVTSINCWQANLRSLQGIEAFTNLRELVIVPRKENVNRIDISALATLNALEHLIVNAQIEDVAPLSSLFNLKTLELKYTDLSDLSFLSVMSGLESLTLSEAQRVDTVSIGKLTQLKELRIRYTWLDDLDNFSNLYQLTLLDASNNELTEVSALSLLIGLESLSLNYNFIDGDVSALHHLNKTNIQLFGNSGIDCASVDFIQSNSGNLSKPSGC